MLFNYILLTQYDIISFLHTPQAYIIREADIIPVGYITRYERIGYHCRKVISDAAAL